MVRSWFTFNGGVRYWRGPTPAEWWLTPQDAPDYPSPWAKPNPEVITDWGRMAVAVPRLLSSHPIKVARELPLGIYLTIHSQRKLNAEGRRLRTQYPTAEVWTEFTLPAAGGAEGEARWYMAAIFLPLAGVKEGMDFLR